jgi:hypothetical protein
VKSKRKFLREIKNTTPVHMNDNKVNSLVADMEKVLVVWIENQNSHNIPLNQILIHSKSLALLNSAKAERNKKAIEETFKASRGWFLRLKKRSRQVLVAHPCNPIYLEG